MHPRTENLPLQEVAERLSSSDHFTKLSLTDIISSPVPNPYDSGRLMYVYHDADLLFLAKALEVNTSLKEFEIRYCGDSRKFNWTAEGALAIGKALKNIPSLDTVTITLQTYSLKRPAIISFLECLTGNGHIKKLNFHFYFDDMESMNYLSLLLLNNESLESISLQGSILSSNPVPINLIDGLMQSKKLTSLCINYLNLGDQGAQRLSTLIAQHPLKSLTLHQCGFTAKGMKHLLPALGAHCNKVRFLDLGYNNFGYEGIQCLVSQLPLLKNLKQLVLTSVGLDEKALDCLVVGLRESDCSVSTLTLDQNRFNLKCMSSIKKLIENNVKLKYLNMNFCELGDIHLLALVDIFSKPDQCSLHGLGFGGNLALSSITKQITLKAIRTNPNLCHFFTGEHIPLIEEATEINKRKKIRRSQADFINACIEFANIYYRAHPDNLLAFSAAFFPKDLLFRIILEVGQGTLGMSEEIMKGCAILIFENFKLRRDLIARGAYDPKMHAKDPGHPISSWWNNSTIINGTIKTLFTSVKKIEHSQQEIEEENVGIVEKIEVARKNICSVM